MTTVYDVTGRPVAVTNGGGDTCTVYDDEGRVASTKAPDETDATKITHTYDPAGAVRTTSDGTRTITSEHDEAGRLARYVDASGAESTFAYDAEGNRTQRTAATGSLSGSTNYVTTYFHDDAGRLASLTDPASRIYSFSYDARGNLKTVLHPNSTFTWIDTLPGGDVGSIYHRHGTWQTPPQTVPADASPISDYAYTYDIAGRRTQQVRTGGGLPSETMTYTYDAVGRLATASLPGGRTQAFTYDLDSNRTRLDDMTSGVTTTTTYSYDLSNANSPGMDQLTSFTVGGVATSFVHSTDGQVTTKGSDLLTWDGRGRLKGGTFGGGALEYAFDPAARRRTRSAAGSVTETYLYAGSEAALFELSGAGPTIVSTSVEGPAGDLAHYAGAAMMATPVTFQYFDGHGDLGATADEVGTRTDSFAYEPFGRQAGGPAPPQATSERWTGRWDKRSESSSGLVEMGARPYDPRLGRFLSVDPIVGGSENNYDFAAQDPVNKYDLDGLAWWNPIDWIFREGRKNFRRHHLKPAIHWGSHKYRIEWSKKFGWHYNRPSFRGPWYEHFKGPGGVLRGFGRGVAHGFGSLGRAVGPYLVPMPRKLMCPQYSGGCSRSGKYEA